TATGILARGNVCSTSASADGTSAAAPTACSMRAATSTPADGASPHSADAAVNAMTAARKVRRRPIRSESRPAGMSSAANTMVYALSTHDSDDVSTDEKSAPIAENATNRIVVSRNTANVARLVENSTTQGFAGCFILRSEYDNSNTRRQALIVWFGCRRSPD